MVNHEPRHRQSLSATGGRGRRKSSSSGCKASINQHDPSFEHRDRGTNADDAVQRKSSTCHRGAALECHGSNVSVKNKLIGPSTSVVFGSRRSATLRCTREAAHGDVYADGGALDPSVRITRIEVRGGRSSRLLETSRVRRETAGSRVNLHEHSCDAKWVMCHAAVMVVLDRESAQDGPASTREEPAGKQRALTQGPVQVTTRRCRSKECYRRRQQSRRWQSNSC